MAEENARESALAELAEYARENIRFVKGMISVKENQLGIENSQSIEEAMSAAVAFAFEPTQEEAQIAKEEEERIDAQLDKAFSVPTKNMSEDEKLDRSFGIESEQHEQR